MNLEIVCAFFPYIHESSIMTSSGIKPIACIFMLILWFILFESEVFKVAMRTKGSFVGQYISTWSQDGKSTRWLKMESYCFLVCASQTQEKVCVVFSVSQPSHTKSFVSADPQLASWSVQGGTRSWTRTLASGTESAAEPAHKRAATWWEKLVPIRMSWYPVLIFNLLPSETNTCVCVCVCRESALSYLCWGSVDGLWLSLQPLKVGFNAGWDSPSHSYQRQNPPDSVCNSYGWFLSLRSLIFMCRSLLEELYWFLSIQMQQLDNSARLHTETSNKSGLRTSAKQMSWNWSLFAPKWWSMWTAADPTLSACVGQWVCRTRSWSFPMRRTSASWPWSLRRKWPWRPSRSACAWPPSCQRSGRLSSSPTAPPTTMSWTCGEKKMDESPSISAAMAPSFTCLLSPLSAPTSAWLGNLAPASLPFGSMGNAAPTRSTNPGTPSIPTAASSWGKTRTNISGAWRPRRALWGRWRIWTCGTTFSPGAWSRPGTTVIRSPRATSLTGPPSSMSSTGTSWWWTTTDSLRSQRQRGWRSGPVGVFIRFSLARRFLSLAALSAQVWWNSSGKNKASNSASGVYLGGLQQRCYQLCPQGGALRQCPIKWFLLIDLYLLMRATEGDHSVR